MLNPSSRHPEAASRHPELAQQAKDLKDSSATPQNDIVFCHPERSEGSYKTSSRGALAPRDLHKESPACLAENFWSLTFFDQVDSTNILIKTAIALGALEGTCYVAREQTGAYGRQGRSWSSPAGGLYFSFVLDPLETCAEICSNPSECHSAHAKTFEDQTNCKPTMADLPSMSLVFSLAVQEALSNYASTEAIRIKWPNDIVVQLADGFAKLCGISLEVVQRKLCVGIGVNVFRYSEEHSRHPHPVIPHSVILSEAKDLKDSSPTVQNDATIHHPERSEGSSYHSIYLEDLGDLSSLDHREVLDDLLNFLLESIQCYYDRWLTEGIETFISQYNSLLFNLGEQVVLETIKGDALVSGVVLGASKSGELLLQQPTGEVMTASSGEVHTIK